MTTTNKYTYNKSKEEIAEMQKEVLRHLNGISNHAFDVSVGEKSFTVEVLILEVQTLTQNGINYINDYYENLEFIQELISRPRVVTIKVWPWYVAAVAFFLYALSVLLWPKIFAPFLY